MEWRASRPRLNARMQEFHYKVGWRARGQRQGFHASASQGSGMEFVGHAPLAGYGDPRRIDIRASLANPTGDWLVRLHRTRAALPVCVVLDLSASMGFAGVRRKLDVVRQFVASAGFSARRTGDAFGLIAADDSIREQVWLPLTHARSAAQTALARLEGVAASHGSAGLLEALHWLPRNRALVFLVSDFHFPLDMLAQLLDGLAHHDVVPVVVWDEAEARRLPGFGLVELADPETGQRRTVLMRASLRRRWIEAVAQRRGALRDCFITHRTRPFFVDGDFDADALTRYFLGDDEHSI
ncbi:MAG: VWA domain-containing protein [Sterolibacteriaceae bacterium]|nr:VWA domain-containing protein [Sterolibacteriaceae bacterium]MBK9084339.1 VWA domain-containing protein [Sterolibacteriaceae bacterium]